MNTGRNQSVFNTIQSNNTEEENMERKQEEVDLLLKEIEELKRLSEENDLDKISEMLSEGGGIIKDLETKFLSSLELVESLAKQEREAKQQLAEAVRIEEGLLIEKRLLKGDRLYFEDLKRGGAFCDQNVGFKIRDSNWEQYQMPSKQKLRKAETSSSFNKWETKNQSLDSELTEVLDVFYELARASGYKFAEEEVPAVKLSDSKEDLKELSNQREGKAQATENPAETQDPKSEQSQGPKQETPRTPNSGKQEIKSLQMSKDKGMMSKCRKQEIKEMLRPEAMAEELAIKKMKEVEGWVNMFIGIEKQVSKTEVKPIKLEVTKDPIRQRRKSFRNTRRLSMMIKPDVSEMRMSTKVGSTEAGFKYILGAVGKADGERVNSYRFLVLQNNLFSI